MTQYLLRYYQINVSNTYQQLEYKMHKLHLVLTKDGLKLQ